MDSLFDVTPFEKPKETKPSSTTLGTGQLDIFGNVVEEPTEFSLVDEPAVVEGESDPSSVHGSDAEAAEAKNLTDALGAPVVVEVLEPIDPEDRVALDDDDSDQEVDVTEALNDPAWEPGIDEMVEAVEEPTESPSTTSAETMFDRVEESLAQEAPAEIVSVGGVAEVVSILESPTTVDGATTHEKPPDVEDAAVAKEAPSVTEDVVASPSVDALWTGVEGQQTAVAQLRNSTLNPVHAFLLHGPPGSGKRAAARSFGAAILCPRGGCGSCDVCLRSLAEVHPDLIVVEREGASISVDQAREIIRLALRSPTEGRRKVLVLVDFHLVSTAGPTLLKIIEEPPESTIFVILADQITNELVTIASRCSKVQFAPIPRSFVIASLIAGGLDQESAERVALAAGGRLDRARLLASDPQLASRLSFWQNIPRRLDGTGATSSVVAGEAIALVEGAAVGPLEERQGQELKELETRLEGTRGGAGLRKELQERHKRELKRLRDDELRFGLTTLQQAFRERAVDLTAPNAHVRHAFRAVATIATANENLVRNPNLGLFLQALFVRLSESSANR